jgi:hypothetical protein
VLSAIGASIVAASFAATPAIAGEIRVDLPRRDGLVFAAPDGWRHQVKSGGPDVPPTISFAPADRRELLVLVTPLWPVAAKGAARLQDVRRYVQAGADRASSRAVEPNVELLEFAGTGKRGFYFSAIDRAPEPDGYRYMTQGGFAFDELNFTFTILMNRDHEANRRQALTMLREMRRAK